MWALVIGSFVGFLTLGHVTPFPESFFVVLLAVLFSLIGLQIFIKRLSSSYILHRLPLVNRFSFLHYVFQNRLFSGCYFILALVLSSSYANHQLVNQLAQTKFTSTEITTTVKVVGISQSVDKNVRQIVTPVAPIQGLPKRWLLKSTYGTSAYEQINQMRPGQLWQITATIKPPHGVASFGVFSEQKWMLTMQTGGVALATNLLPIQTDDKWSKLSQDGLANYRLSLRYRIKALSDNPSHQQDKAVLLALLTGDTALIAPQTKQLYQKTGISHLLAISGPHVLFAAGLFVWLLMRVFNRFPNIYRFIKRWQIVMPSALLVAIGYALLSGWELPAQRTVWMFAIATMLSFFYLRWQIWQIMLLSACIILYLNPLAVLSAAFWLSFVAVGLLVLLQQGIKLPRLLIKTLNGNNINKSSMIQRIAQKIMSFAYVQVIFFVGILPISLLFFKEVSWLAPLVNLVAIPVLGFIIVPLNICAYLLSLVSDWLANGLWQVLLWIIHGFHGFLSWLVDFVPNSMMHLYLDKVALWACVVMGIILLVPVFRNLRLLVIPLLVLILFPRKLPAPAVITVLDGSGFSAVLIQTSVNSSIKPTKNLLYISDISYKQNNLDYDVSRLLVPSLQAMGVDELDTLIISLTEDKDKKQIASNRLANLLKIMSDEISIQQVLSNSTYDNKESDIVKDNKELKKLSKKHTIQQCRAGETWQWGNVGFLLLSPWQDVPLVGDDGACVLKIKLRDTETDNDGQINSAVLLGNASQFNQKMLMALCTDLSADVLMLAKQGSKSAYYEPIITKVNPNSVFVGKKFSGFNTSKQHPHLMVTAELLNKQKVIHTTNQKGSVQYFLGSPKTSVKWYRQKYPWLATEK